MATQVIKIDVMKVLEKQEKSRLELEALDLLVDVSELSKDKNVLNQLIASNRQKIKLGCKCFGRVSELAEFIGRKKAWVSIAKSILRRLERGENMEEAIEEATDIWRLGYSPSNTLIIQYRCPRCKRYRVMEITENTQFIGHYEDFCKERDICRD